MSVCLIDVFFFLIYAMFREENVLSITTDEAEQPDDTPGRLEQHEGQAGVARQVPVLTNSVYITDC